MNRRARKYLAAAGWLAAAPFIALASRWLHPTGSSAPRESEFMSQYEQRRS